MDDNLWRGTCINVGCIPSKSLIHSAALSKVQGGSFAEKAARYREAIAEKRRLTSALLRRGFAWGDVREAWSRLGAEILEE